MKHTKLPWFVRKAGTGAGAHYSIMYQTNDGIKSIPETLTNKEFIVRACNAHDDLVAALELVIENHVPKINPLSDAAILSARAALAKAKG